MTRGRPEPPRLAARAFPTALMSGLLSILVATACTRPTPPSPASAPEEASLAFAPARIDLGRTVAGGTLIGSATLRAMTPATVRVAQVLSGCECTTVELGPGTEISPDHPVRVSVRLELFRLARGGLPRDAGDGLTPLEREITVVADDGTSARLVVAAEISQALTVEPLPLELSEIASGETATGSLVVRAGAGRAGEDLGQPRVLDVLVDDPSLRIARPQEAGGGRVELRWGPLQEAGKREAWITLVTDSGELPRVQVPVSVGIVPFLSVSPATIETDAAFPGQPFVTTVSVRRHDGAPFEVSGVLTRTSRVLAQLLPADPSDPVRRIRVVVPVFERPRTVDDTLEIVTDVSGQARIRVPIHVGAAEAKRP